MSFNKTSFTRASFYFVVCLNLIFQCGFLNANGTFYRIIEGQRPNHQEQELNEFLYGTKILYTGDAQTGKPTLVPILVQGIVWHDSLALAKYFIGTQNPNLEQVELLKQLENNKWEEAKLLTKYAPSYFPKTENMRNVLELYSQIETKGYTSKEELLNSLKTFLITRYPNGFFLKPINGFNSAGTFPSDTTNFVDIWTGYISETKPKLQVLAMRLKNSDEVHLKAKGWPFYSGRVLELLFTAPEKVIIQEKLHLKKGAIQKSNTTASTTPNTTRIMPLEFRVHVVQGKVLVGATVHRWEDAANETDHLINEVEDFAQNLMLTLPENYQRLSYALDIVVTEDGKYKVIEMNTGGDSGYYYPETSLKITHLLASRFLGKPTPILELLKRFDEAKNFAERERIIKQLLSHKAIRSIAQSPDHPLSEALEAMKKSLLNFIKTYINEASWYEVINLISSFKLFFDNPTPMISNPCEKFLIGY